MIELTLQCLYKKKAIALFPILILYVLLPVLIKMFFYHFQDEYDRFLLLVTQQFHVWIPITGVWWIIVLFHDFVDCEGNELLYRLHGTKYFFCVAGFVIILHSIISAPLCIFCISKYEIGFFLMIQLFLETVTILSLAYFLCFFLQNTGACFLIIVAYCLYMVLFDTAGILDFISIFPCDNYGNEEEIIRLKNMGIATGIFLFLGTICSRIRRVYK